MMITMVVVEYMLPWLWWRFWRRCDEDDGGYGVRVQWRRLAGTWPKRRRIYEGRHKFHANGTLSRYKARLVANSSSQQLGVDFDKTFSLVVKPATVRMVLILAMSCKWPIYQHDFKNDFLNGDLSEIVYMHQPPGFVDNQYPHPVCLLQRSLYGLKQGSQVAYLLIYVDDIILIASYPTLLQQIIGSLNNEFDMTDLGALNYFLGISADRTPTESKLGSEGVPVQDPTLYRSLAGGSSILHLHI
ncbi:ribonuclease H-like domain-containing protein [Tanacetum coccineum]|uniref:Ribonuclease H-like domain-containing protein n=1 Tax=Tanacetum coccineum TaxID=301880 RepID=A0ABQ5DAK9_9ASTR